MTDKDKIVDLNRYREDKAFEGDLIEHLLDITDDEIDDLYGDIAFGDGLHDSAQDGFDLLSEIRMMEKLEKEGRSIWQSAPDDEKSWRNLEMRPYLAIRMELAQLYKQHGLYDKALNLLLPAYQADPNDPLGCRYEIMSLYVLKSDYIMADVFFRNRKENADDSLMAIPMLVAAILHGDDFRAGELMEELSIKVDGFFDFCIQSEFPVARVLEAGALESYQPNSEETIYLAFYNILPLMLTASAYVQAWLSDYFMEDEDEVYLDEFGILSTAQLLSLEDYGIRTKTDISQCSEAELLCIPKIGKVSVQKLKEAGVTFKEE